MNYVDAHHHIWPYTELPWLAGKVVALGRELRVPTPTFDVMYAALKPYANGTPS